MAQQARPKVVDEANRQEGSRWVGKRPTGEEVAHWFQSVPLDEGMRHEDHIGGITIISAKETRLELQQGQFVDVERLVHVPYPRVDSRIAYFWQLCAANGWTGEIAPVNVPRTRAPGMNNENLPPGFAKVPVILPDKRVVTYITCTQRVTVTLGDSGRFQKSVRNPPPATKQVPLVDRWGKPDDNAMMKAETGAIGRALGMAGVFVIPGAGVATAEDMQEYLAQTGAAAGAPEPALPDDSTPENIRDRIKELMGELNEPGLAEFQTWVRERGFDLENLRETQERGVLRKLEGLVG